MCLRLSSRIPNITHIRHYFNVGKGYHGHEAGTVLVIKFKLDDHGSSA